MVRRCEQWHSVEYRTVLKSGEGCHTLLLAVGGSFRALCLRFFVESFIALQATFGAWTSSDTPVLHRRSRDELGE